MNKIIFNHLVSKQTEITNHKTVVEYYKKITKLCGFLNQKGYNDSEYGVTPLLEYEEVRLIKDDDTYSDYVKVESRNETPVWYGINGDYFIKNIGNDCHIVYEITEN